MGKFNQKKNLYTSIEEVPLSLFCSNRINFKSLNDIQFSKLLNHIRYIYRYMNKKENSFYVLNLLVKRSIPLVKIIYQRRGRSLIPLMNFIYQSDKNSDVRKEAYSRGYYLKTLKARFRNS